MTSETLYVSLIMLTLAEGSIFLRVFYFVRRDETTYTDTRLSKIHLLFRQRNHAPTEGLVSVISVRSLILNRCQCDRRLKGPTTFFFRLWSSYVEIGQTKAHINPEFSASHGVLLDRTTFFFFLCLGTRAKMYGGFIGGPHTFILSRIRPPH